MRLERAHVAGAALLGAACRGWDGDDRRAPESVVIAD
jgi:hypothetical protein